MQCSLNLQQLTMAIDRVYSYRSICYHVNNFAIRSTVYDVQQLTKDKKFSYLCTDILNITAVKILQCVFCKTEKGNINAM